MGACVSANISISDPQLQSPEPKIVIDKINNDDNEITTITESVSLPTWTERRNSEKEKHNFSKQKIEMAQLELQRRYSVGLNTNSRCPVCGNIGPDSSNQYYTFYLIVPAIVSKSKCKQCDINYSFKYIGLVKTEAEALELILNEEN